jgi:hypothetical protein
MTPRIPEPSGRPLLHLSEQQVKAWAKRALLASADNPRAASWWLAERGLDGDNLARVLAAIEGK